jgi:hypothetical protein
MVASNSSRHSGVFIYKVIIVILAVALIATFLFLPCDHSESKFSDLPRQEQNKYVSKLKFHQQQIALAKLQRDNKKLKEMAQPQEVDVPDVSVSEDGDLEALSAQPLAQADPTALGEPEVNGSDAIEATVAEVTPPFAAPEMAVEPVAKDAVKEVQEAVNEAIKEFPSEAKKIVEAVKATGTPVVNTVQPVAQSSDEKKPYQLKKIENNVDRKPLAYNAIPDAIIKCTTVEKGSVSLPRMCQDDLANKLEELPKDAIYRIIPLVDENDFNLFARLEKESQEKKEHIDFVKNFANIGLGKARSNEAAWLVRQVHGRDVRIEFVSYDVRTKIDRGVMIHVFK